MIRQYIDGIKHDERSLASKTIAGHGSTKPDAVDIPFHKPSTAISVIVCTRNRPTSLRAMLEALAGVDLSGVQLTEVIVVDNGPDASTELVVNDFVQTTGLPIRRIVEPSPGLSRARNTGIAASHGQIIAFTDDDCLPSKSWLRAIANAFKGNPRQVIAGSVVLHDQTHLSMSIREGSEPELLTRAEQVGGFLLGANMAFGRTVWVEIGPFDTEFGAGTTLKAAEDTEFTFRALLAEIPVRYDPMIKVRHDHGRTEPSEMSELLYGYAIGTGAMALKHALQGDDGLLRSLYWDFRSCVRNTLTTPSRWRELAARRGFLTGALKYALLRLKSRRLR